MAVADAGIDVRVSRGVPPLAALVLCYGALAALVSPGTYREMLADYAGQVGAVLPLMLVCLAAAGLMRNPSRPVDEIRTMLRSGGTRLLALIVLAVAGLAGFTTFKLSIPAILPFYADPALAHLDAVLHGGDPGLLLHAVIPDWLGYVIAYLYGPVWLLCWFGFMGFVALHPDAALRQRYFWTLCAAILGLGTIAATLFSSVGPFLYQHFYGVDRFSALDAAIAASPVGEYMHIAGGYLLHSYGVGRPSMGTGISAMPSMHLAIATLNALMLGRVHPAAGAMGSAYLLIILVGSVYLGWHYAVDGYASIAAVCLLWALVGRLMPRSGT